MGHKWIIDVLADLKSFATQNDLILLADKLEQATQVASAEITGSNTTLIKTTCGWIPLS